MLHKWCNRNARWLALAVFASGLFATGWSFGSPGVSASATQPKYGSLLVHTDVPGGGLANGYCLTASGPSTFTTAGSGTDGNLGEINQANVVPGKYVGPFTIVVRKLVVRRTGTSSSRSRPTPPSPRPTNSWREAASWAKFWTPTLGPVLPMSA